MTLEKINNLDEFEEAFWSNALDGEKVAQCDIRSQLYGIATIKEKIKEDAINISIELKGKKIVKAEPTDFGLDLYLSDDNGNFYRLTAEDGKLEMLSRDLDRIEPLPF